MITRDVNASARNTYSISNGEPPQNQELLINIAHTSTAPLLVSPTSSTDDARVYKVKSLLSESKSLVKSILDTASVILKQPASRFCLVAYMLKRIAFASEGFMFQYASEKFLWPLQQTTWLRVAQASSAIVATLLLCPLATLILSSPRAGDIPSHVVDLGMIRSALLILTISFFSAWKAPSAMYLIVCMWL
jgi:hypothetical protein